MSRQLDQATSDRAGAPSLGWAYFMRLDILGDPIIAWTGWGDLAMANTGDAAMDGQTFQGITHLVGDVSTATDQEGGSQALVLSLPGVDLEDEALKQVVYDRRTWQFRQAWLWGALLDDSGAVVGKPFRLKTGRMDSMSVEEDDQGNGTVKCQIESAQAYEAEALQTRYSEQREIDPNDSSQDTVWALANVTPSIGQATYLAGSAASVSTPGTGYDGYYMRRPNGQ